MTENLNTNWNTEWTEIALNSANVPVFWLNKQARIVKFNRVCLDVFEYGEKELSALTLFDLDEQMTKKEWKSNWSALSQNETHNSESNLRTKTGTILTSQLNFVFIELATDNLCCVIINYIQKQEHFEAEPRQPKSLIGDQTKTSTIEMLAQSEKKNQLILDSAGEGIYGLNKDGHTTFVNKAAYEMIGWDLEELVGKSQHDILHHSHSDGAPYEVTQCPIYAAINDGLVHTVDDEVFWRKDGTSFPVEYTSTPIKDTDGTLVGAVVVFRDITRRRESELALKEANVGLQNALLEVEKLKTQLEEENRYLQQEIQLSNNFEEIISQSKKFKSVFLQVEQVAQTDATVLVLGESGTGKELIARAVHNLSKRATRPLVKVNCAALPANLIESELFGHERGAFTGALTQRTGRFQLANGGTIFLDEIGEIPIELQSKLLRVLQEGEFERLGSSQTVKVNVRIIAATNRNLESEIKKGTFREDLFYRLNVFPLQLPPLRERPEDIPLLVQHFVRKFGIKFGKKIEIISQKIMNQLIGYSWAGNVRELENVIERAVIISKGNKLDLGNALANKSSTSHSTQISTLEEIERMHILKALKSTTWRVSGAKGAAKILGLNRTTLEARMKKLGIKRPTE